MTTTTFFGAGTAASSSSSPSSSSFGGRKRWTRRLCGPRLGRCGTTTRRRRRRRRRLCRVLTDSFAMFSNSRNDDVSREKSDEEETVYRLRFTGNDAGMEVPAISLRKGECVDRWSSEETVFDGCEKFHRVESAVGLDETRAGLARYEWKRIRHRFEIKEWDLRQRNRDL